MQCGCVCILARRLLMSRSLFSDDSDGQDEGRVRFRGSLKHGTVLLSLLQAIVNKERPECMVCVDQSGVRATVETSRVMQGSAVLPAHLFRQFRLTRGTQSQSVCIDLTQLLQSLGRVSDGAADDGNDWTPDSLSQQSSADCSLDLEVDQDSGLMLRVADGDVVTEVRMAPIRPSFALFPCVPEQSVSSRVSLPSSAFAEMWLDFDPHAEQVGLHVDDRTFRLWFKSTDGQTELQLSHKPQSDVTYQYTSPEPSCSYLFRMSLIKETIHSLLMSKSTTIATADLTSITYRILVDADGDTADIQYLMLAKHTNPDDPIPQFADHLSDDESDAPADVVPLGADHSTFTHSVHNLSIADNRVRPDAGGDGGGTYPVPAVEQQQDNGQADEEWDDDGLDEELSAVV